MTSDMESRDLRVGQRLNLDDVAGGVPTGAPTEFVIPPHHLVTHGIVLGMTGSGKTGLLMVMVEEALRSRVPTILIDIKGDLPNLLFLFPELDAASFAPWIDGEGAARAGQTPAVAAEAVATKWREGLAGSNLGGADIRSLRESVAIRVVTPGATIAEPLDVLSALSQRSPLWGIDDEAAHDKLSAGISLVLRLVGEDGDPRSREHLVLSTLAMRRIDRGEAAPLPMLLGDLLKPPVANIGAMPFDQFFPPTDRQRLAQGLNTLLASPRLASWLKGASLDIASWLEARPDGRTPAVIVSVAHLDDEERGLVLGLLLDEMLSYVRGLSGSSTLRALLVFDEIFGFLPPHPHNPPTKRPLLALLKQARAFGVGTLLATQNPMDVDYKALSNAGAWIIGRLQTDADRERVVEGLRGADGGLVGLEPEALANTLRNLPPRAFFVRDVHQKPACSLMRSRFAMSYLRGPITRRELAVIAKSLTDGPVVKESTQAAPTATVTSASDAPGALVVASPALPASPAAVAASPASPNGALVETPTVSRVAPTIEGWHTWFEARRQAAALSPQIVATVAVRLRDAKLGFAAERRATVRVPLDPAGRLDLARATFVVPADLSESPPPSASFGELPASVGTKKGREAIERSLRDHASAQGASDVEVHRGLKLARADDEPAELFRARCARESAASLGEIQRKIHDAWAPHFAKLETKRALAERERDHAHASLSSAPSDLGAAFVGIALGRQAGARFAKGRTKAESALAKAHEALIKADTEVRAAVAERDAELHTAARDAAHVVYQIETVRVLPKKGDAEVVSIGILWAGGP